VLFRSPVVGLTMMRTLVDRLRYTTSYLQKVMDSIQRLSRGEYQDDVATMTLSQADEQILVLIDSFLNMVRSVKAREATLKQEAGEQSSTVE
jgi:hypothetical protein